MLVCEPVWMWDSNLRWQWFCFFFIVQCLHTCILFSIIIMNIILMSNVLWVSCLGFVLCSCSVWGVTLQPHTSPAHIKDLDFFSTNVNRHGLRLFMVNRQIRKSPQLYSSPVLLPYQLAILTLSNCQDQKAIDVHMRDQMAHTSCLCYSRVTEENVADMV